MSKLVLIFAVIALLLNIGLAWEEVSQEMEYEGREWCSDRGYPDVTAVFMVDSWEVKCMNSIYKEFEPERDFWYKPREVLRRIDPTSELLQRSGLVLVAGATYMIALKTFEHNKRPDSPFTTITGVLLLTIIFLFLWLKVVTSLTLLPYMLGIYAGAEIYDRVTRYNQAGGEP